MTGSGLMKFLTLPIRFPRWKLAVSFCRHSLPFPIQNSPNPPFRLTRTLRFSIKPACDCKQMQTKFPKSPLILENYTSHFRNTYILAPKQYCFTRQTLVFGNSNNIVSPPKPYCFIRGSQMFEEWNAKIPGFILQKEYRVNKSEAITTPILFPFHCHSETTTAPWTSE